MCSTAILRGLTGGRPSGAQEKECLFLTNKAIILLKTKDQVYEQSQTKPFEGGGKPRKTESEHADLKVGATACFQTAGWQTQRTSSGYPLRHPAGILPRRAAACILSIFGREHRKPLLERHTTQRTALIGIGTRYANFLDAHGTGLGTQRFQQHLVLINLCHKTPTL